MVNGEVLAPATGFRTTIAVDADGGRQKVITMRKRWRSNKLNADGSASGSREWLSNNELHERRFY